MWQNNAYDIKMMDADLKLNFKLLKSELWDFFWSFGGNLVLFYYTTVSLAFIKEIWIALSLPHSNIS